LLLLIADIALQGVPSRESLPMTVARWLLGGIVYGMAAVGLYSQGRQLSQRGEQVA
jgi:surface antigen